MRLGVGNRAGAEGFTGVVCECCGCAGGANCDVFVVSMDILRGLQEGLERAHLDTSIMNKTSPGPWRNNLACFQMISKRRPKFLRQAHQA